MFLIRHLVGVILDIPLGLVIAYFISNIWDKSLNRKKGWGIVFLITWVICAIWSWLVGMDAFWKLFGGFGFILIPSAIALLVRLVSCRFKLKNKLSSSKS